MKRILFIDHPQFTSATYCLWQGLKEIESLYPEDLEVSSYPYIPTNYDSDSCDLRSLPWFNQMKDLVDLSKIGKSKLPFGIPSFGENEHLTAENAPSILRGYPWFRPKRQNAFESEEQVVSSLVNKKFDVIVLGNSHRVPTIALGRLKELVPNLQPIVYYDAGERDELNEHWIHVFQPAVVFKQILTPAVMERGMTVPISGYKLKLYPLPLASQIVDYDIHLEGLSIQWLRRRSQTVLKMIPVFYYMGETWPARAKAMKAIDEIVFRKNLSRVKMCQYADYHYILANAKMAVTMRGSGRDTTRYWEIPLYKTALVSDGTMGCIHPYPFEHQKTAMFYRSIDELAALVEAGISEGSDADRVSGPGQEHLWKYHSTAARAVFFMDILDREINFFDQGLKNSIGKWKWSRRWDGRPWGGPTV